MHATSCFGTAVLMLSGGTGHRQHDLELTMVPVHVMAFKQMHLAGPCWKRWQGCTSQAAPAKKIPQIELEGPA